MKIFLIVLTILLMCIPAYADEVFSNEDLNQLYVVEVNQEEGWALVRDSSADESYVYIGDHLGLEGGEVVDMDGASITIQDGNNTTKMLLFGKEGLRKIDEGPSADTPSLFGE